MSRHHPPPVPTPDGVRLQWIEHDDRYVLRMSWRALPDTTMIIETDPPQGVGGRLVPGAVALRSAPGATSVEWPPVDRSGRLWLQCRCRARTVPDGRLSEWSDWVRTR